ncbi:amidohydrolase family protein [Mycoplasma sp. NEAQ87857]|uniref:amidohydrolase n=1 Tax=Mycoplasma sp. NEAQ87857 TaxID=2683967 RepID=UPI0013180E31|nr:amidohydrolase [Mycoplasma sp. NEAQ87857]QGZ97627.1 amidohydrolase family protein [Mycoplasma sp. NEAQ87857]
MKILIKNATIVTMDLENEVLYKHHIYIQDNLILKVSKDLDYTFKPDITINANNDIVMPGLINMHTHVPMTLMRNYAEDVNLESWLFDHIFPFEDQMTYDDVYYGAKLGIMEMIQTGTTSFLDMYFHPQAIIQAAKEIGVRAFIAPGFVNNNLETRVKNQLELFDKYHLSNNGLIQIFTGPHAVYTNDANSLKIAHQLALNTSKTIHIHLNESLTEVNNCLKETNYRPMEYINHLNLTQDVNLIAAHAIHLDQNEMQIAKKHNISLVHNPSSNLKIASGVMDITKYLNFGINVALGTDGAASNNNLNMFNEIKLAALLAKGIYHNLEHIKSYDILKMATVNGTKALKMDHILGKIKANYLADLIILNHKSINFQPQSNLIDALVYSCNAKDVKTVIIDGKIVQKNYKLLINDFSNTINKVNEAYNRIIKEL